MKIVPFKEYFGCWVERGASLGKRRLRVLWLLGGARRQLHGKRRLRVLWLLGGARRQLHGKRRLRVLWLLGGGALSMHAKKGGISTSTAETLMCCFNCWCTHSVISKEMKFILSTCYRSFARPFGFFFLLDLHFYTVIIIGVLFCFQG
jgi:hypothetical protein